MSDPLLKHPGLLYSQDITTICNPLKLLGITYFAHVRITKNQEFSAITNNHEFTQHYINNKYYNADIHMADDNKLGKNIIWDAIERFGQSAKMHSEAGEFGVKHTFTVVEKNAEHNNYYHFANNSSSQAINQIYLSQVDLLESFIKHFNHNISQSKKLSSAYQLSYKIDPDAAGYQIENQEDINLTETQKLEFLNHLTQGDNLETQLLSTRQLECLFYLIKGMTMKQISHELNLSPKTIEHYLENIKIKFNCSSRSELLAKAWRMGIWKAFK
jgi:DNA-binding CsgD family transcriptional regulator